MLLSTFLIYHAYLENTLVERENVYLRFDNIRKTYEPSWENELIRYKNYLETFLRMSILYVLYAFVCGYITLVNFSFII